MKRIVEILSLLAAFTTALQDGECPEHQEHLIDQECALFGVAPGKNRGEWAVDSSTCMSCELLSCEPAEIDCGEGGELIGDVERGTCSCLPEGAG